MILSETELFEITKRTRHHAQVRALRAMGIEHRVRPDGSVVVLKAHVEHLLGGPTPAKAEKPIEPNWGPLAKAS